MLVKEIVGLKYPDELVTRFFFKEGLHNTTGRVLELGCGNGNNLSLFYQYGWDVTGVDIDKAAIEACGRNFSNLKQSYSLSNTYEFILDDMLHYLEHTKEKEFDAVVLASSIYYMELSKIERLLQLLKEKNILALGAAIYVRVRKIDDYRYGKGSMIGVNSFKLTIKETGEEGCEMTFFSEDEFMDLFLKYISLSYVRKLSIHYDNYQNEIIIPNSDLIVWGKHRL